MDIMEINSDDLQRASTSTGEDMDCGLYEHNYANSGNL